MSNCNLPVRYSRFEQAYDNLVQPMEATWSSFSESLTSGHAVSDEPKLSLPCFSAWRYKDVSDPTIDHGTDSDGNALEQFSITHTRRIQGNLVEMTMLVLDFDGELPISEVQSKFGDLEYLCYTSLNHRIEEEDKFRVVFPLASPMPVADFRRLSAAIEHWLAKDRAVRVDESTLDIGRVFILPATRDDRRPLAQAWRNEGEPLDWRSFESIPIATQQKASASVRKNAIARLKLKPDDVLDTATGSITVRDIDRKIPYVRCPFHVDAKPSEFVAVSKGGTPYLVCKKCGTIYMDRARNDDIIDGLAKIAERKRLRAEREAQQ